MDIDSVIKQIDEMTEAQAKNFLEYVAAKHQTTIYIKDSKNYYSLMILAPHKQPVYLGCNLQFIDINKDLCEKTSIYKTLLKMIFDKMNIYKKPIEVPYLESEYPVFMPIDKTLDEWLIEMDLNN